MPVVLYFQICEACWRKNALLISFILSFHVPKLQPCLVWTCGKVKVHTTAFSMELKERLSGFRKYISSVPASVAECYIMSLHIWIHCSQATLAAVNFCVLWEFEIVLKISERMYFVYLQQQYKSYL